MCALPGHTMAQKKHLSDQLVLVCFNPPHPVSKCCQFICVCSIWSEISQACLTGDSPPILQSGGHVFLCLCHCKQSVLSPYFGQAQKAYCLSWLGKGLLGNIYSNKYNFLLFLVLFKIEQNYQRSKQGSNDSRINIPY